MPTVGFGLTAEDKGAQATVDQFFRAFKRSIKSTTASIGQADNTLSGFIGRRIAIDPVRLLEKAWQGATAALAAYNEEREAAAQTIIQDEVSLGELAQVSNSGADLSGLIDATRATQSQAGVSAERAAGLQFSLRSSGQDTEADRDAFANLFDLTDTPAQLVGGVAQIKSNFGDAAGDTGTILDNLFAASAQSPASVSEFAPAAAAAAPFAAKIGASDEETFAAIAKLAESAGSAAIASTQFSAFAQKANLAGLGGGDLQDTIGAVEAELGKGRDINDILGKEKQAQLGFAALSSQKDSITALESDLGSSAGFVDARLADRGSIDDLQKAKALRQETQRREVAESRHGIGEVAQDTLAQGLIADTTGEDAITRMFTRAFVKAADVANVDATAGRRDTAAAVVGDAAKAIPVFGAMLTVLDGIRSVLADKTGTPIPVGTDPANQF